MGAIQIHHAPHICFSVFILQEQWGNGKLCGVGIFIQYLGVEFFCFLNYLLLFPPLLPAIILKNTLHCKNFINV